MDKSIETSINIKSYIDGNRTIFYIGNKELWVGKIDKIKDNYRLSLMDWFSKELIGTYDECYNHLIAVLKGETKIINIDE